MGSPDKHGLKNVILISTTRPCRSYNNYNTANTRQYEISEVFFKEIEIIQRSQ